MRTFNKSKAECGYDMNHIMNYPIFIDTLEWESLTYHGVLALILYFDPVKLTCRDLDRISKHIPGLIARFKIHLSGGKVEWTPDI